jgi:hypothetical protein
MCDPEADYFGQIIQSHFCAWERGPDGHQVALEPVRIASDASVLEAVSKRWSMIVTNRFPASFCVHSLAKDCIVRVIDTQLNVVFDVCFLPDAIADAVRIVDRAQSSGPSSPMLLILGAQRMAGRIIIVDVMTGRYVRNKSFPRASMNFDATRNPHWITIHDNHGFKLYDIVNDALLPVTVDSSRGYARAWGREWFQRELGRPRLVTVAFESLTVLDISADGSMAQVVDCLPLTPLTFADGQKLALKQTGNSFLVAFPLIFIYQNVDGKLFVVDLERRLLVNTVAFEPTNVNEMRFCGPEWQIILGLDDAVFAFGM